MGDHTLDGRDLDASGQAHDSTPSLDGRDIVLDQSRDTADARDAFDLNWGRMLNILQMELISRGGSPDCVDQIREWMKWSESERKQLKEGSRESLETLKRINEQMRGLKVTMEEALDAKDCKLDKLRADLDKREDLLLESFKAMKLLKADLDKKKEELAVAQARMASL